MIEYEIIKAEKKLFTSILKGDIQELDKILHDHLLFNNLTGETETKSVTIGGYTRGKTKIKEIKPSEREISIIGDTAVVTVLIELKGIYQDKVINGKYRQLWIWKQFKEKWLVIGGSTGQIYKKKRPTNTCESLSV